MMFDQERSNLMIKINWMILIAAFIAFLISVSLWFGGNKEAGLFVGIWVPSIFAFGAFVSLSDGRSRNV
jgi:hypothetical protein